MQNVSVYASQAQYWRHLSPIVDVLRARGVEVDVFSEYPWQPWGRPLLTPQDVQTLWVIVAGAIDARSPLLPGRELVYVEHGAGQSYVDGPPEGYVGDPTLGRVSKFIAPNMFVAHDWSEQYPDAQAMSVGCIPVEGVERDMSAGPKTNVYWTAHWRCGVNPETWPALWHYEPQVETLTAALDANGLRLVGHAHPRDRLRVAEFWRSHGIPFEPDPDVVLADACLVVADNTSLLYEAALLDIPTLCLNIPTYRRAVEHGLRFWSHVPGLQCDRPDDLAAAFWRANRDPADARALRAAAVARAYHPQGPPAATAAAFILEDTR